MSLNKNDVLSKLTLHTNKFSGQVEASNFAADATLYCDSFYFGKDRSPCSERGDQPTAEDGGDCQICGFLPAATLI